MRGWKMVPVLLVLLFTASTSFAAGFRLPEAGAKAMGMGFAFTAQADDPSAIYFNPAGLTQLKGQNVMIGVTYVRENGNEFTGTTPVDNQTAIKSETQKSLDFYIPNAYYTKTTADGYIAYGVGIFAPFGLGQEYNDKNTSIFRNQITKIDLQTIVVNPTIAFKINEALSVGFGVDWMYGKAKLEKTPWVPGVGNLYNVELEGDGDVWGYNFGMLLKPTENLRIGVNYRSKFNLKVKDADVNIGNTSPAYASGLFGPTPTSTKGSATIAMPATFALGAAYTMWQADGGGGRGLDVLAQLQQSPDHHPESGSDASQHGRPETVGGCRRPAVRGGVSGDRPAFLASGRSSTTRRRSPHPRWGRSFRTRTG